ncbi:AGR035Cp [Eremothecium gossypii ATCC 10895]|uniref:Small ribosomal subunit protein uS10m n=1 Tax=Eremothecium gossypii (strain ATCC 10895 / CBS 109.51 / FGSC 9923 / NRRL Y-1056) TaxID=284811 RepID=RT10_EREGS|nr:mitochondrial 37S ribosomal protein RSM10 [Eremothecium gossypii ATCC 10895]Q750C2.1 RecName: Full=Small ribosomal subunit protein uS10m; AltName: Full=37S ribosomal protein S10, mitochondrial; AltName: Full=Mitochondrial ribosomal small subunit protein 10; Flags: Precursor [Eremothecium gossypii ATCC 10895]AAS54524.1 AGR035Cp [Eremothecium gossypii ATCC 10895]AEY98856.1 FAGR035Cp [Eremothecium gossypii FDAG1]
MLSVFGLRTVARCNSTLASGGARAAAAAGGKAGAQYSALPKSVHALYFQPLKLPVKHHDLVADLQLRAFDNQSLDFFANFALRVGYYLGIPMTGPKPLPTRRERWTVIRAPFAHAKSKENFERHTHKRLLRLWDANPEVVEMFLSYITKHSMAGVGMKCNMFQRESVQLAQELADVPLAPGAPQTADEVVGAKVAELMQSPEFKKHL